MRLSFMLMLHWMLLVLQIRTQSHSMTQQVSPSTSTCMVHTHNSHSKRRGQVVAISQQPAVFTCSPRLLPSTPPHAAACCRPVRRRRQVLFAGKGNRHLCCLLHAFLLTVAAAAWYHSAESCAACSMRPCPQLQQLLARQEWPNGLFSERHVSPESSKVANSVKLKNAGEMGGRREGGEVGGIIGVREGSRRGGK